MVIAVVVLIGRLCQQSHRRRLHDLHLRNRKFPAFRLHYLHVPPLPHHSGLHVHRHLTLTRESETPAPQP